MSFLKDEAVLETGGALFWEWIMRDYEVSRYEQLKGASVPDDVRNSIRRIFGKENEMDNQPRKEMPKYKCHKEVWALKISKVTFDKDESGNPVGSGATLEFEDDGYAPIHVDKAYIDKHLPDTKGYYVVYKDGYASWSPADVFEDGYTLIE